LGFVAGFDAKAGADIGALNCDAGTPGLVVMGCALSFNLALRPHKLAYDSYFGVGGLTVIELRIVMVRCDSRLRDLKAKNIY